MGRKRLLQKHQVLKAIEQWLVRHGLPPTIEELRSTLGLRSTRTALNYLRELEESGDIERWPGARGMRLLKRPRAVAETIPVPLIGEAPAGPLMVAEENREGWIRIPREFLKPSSGKFFLLRVRGNSMNRAPLDGGPIEDGDLVLVRLQPTANPGEIVVALIDGEATIKRFEIAPGYFVLKPQSSDPHFAPIVINDDFRIQGIVCRVLKKGSNILSIES